MNGSSSTAIADGSQRAGKAPAQLAAVAVRRDLAPRAAAARPPGPRACRAPRLAPPPTAEHGVPRRHEQRRRVRGLVVVEHHLLDVRRTARDRLFDQLRAVLLAIVGDQQALHAAEDVEEAVRIEVTEVARCRASRRAAPRPSPIRSASSRPSRSRRGRRSRRARRRAARCPPASQIRTSRSGRTRPDDPSLWCASVFAEMTGAASVRP